MPKQMGPLALVIPEHYFIDIGDLVIQKTTI